MTKKKKEKPTIPCEICGVLYVVINETHLKTHDYTLKQYIETFPSASIIEAFNCLICKSW